MNYRMAEELNELVFGSVLDQVKNPAQYIGGEWNQVRRAWEAGTLKVALAFPDTYEIGMSHLGLAILYEALNRMAGVLAERVFCPWVDARDAMRQGGIELFSWESRRAVRSFDVLGITLQHELCYSNVLYLLDLAGIEFYSRQRSEEMPLVIAGGPMADCCEPVADFFDLVILGDGEESLPAVVEVIRQMKQGGGKRQEILLALARQFDFVYVPQFYECSYDSEGRLSECKAKEEGIAGCVKRAQVENLDEAVFPAAPIVPYVQTPHDRISIEIMRGCPQRCAFCHAGHSKGKVRCRSVQRIVDLAWQSYLATGHDTVSLLSLSSSDYPQLGELVRKLYERFEGRHVGISLPSLRVDRQLKDVPGEVTLTRREGLTVAVETASDRIRKAIGKQVTDTDLMATMRAAYEAGWRKVKLYFMVGFPGESREDVAEILNLAAAISRLRQEVSGGVAAVNAAVSWLVPKPHTPLQWIPQREQQYFEWARELLYQNRRELRGASVKLKFHSIERSILEGVFARGDRRLSRVLEEAYRLGACFDSWDECFRYEIYQEAFQRCGLDPGSYAHRDRNADECLPWDHLSGEDKEILYRRCQKLLSMIQDKH